MSSTVDFESHDEPSVIEPMETHDGIPVPSRMVNHDVIGRKQSPSRAPDPTNLDLSVLMAELQQDLAAGPELLSQMKSNIDGLVQDSSVLIDDHDREQKAKQIVKKFIARMGCSLHSLIKDWKERKHELSKPLLHKAGVCPSIVTFIVPVIDKERNVKKHNNSDNE